MFFRKILLFIIAFFLLHQSNAQNANDLIISELMINPKPSHGLPEKEYLEIYNRTDKAISLNNLRLQINTVSHILSNISILPKEYAIICEKADEQTFGAYGKVITLSSIALSNTSATVSLKDAKNKTIFSVSYTDKLYTAGYSFEMIDINYPCVEEGNWASSTTKDGGTPAKENSVKANKPDTTPPSLVRYEISNSTTVKLVFSEKLDSLSAINKLNYSTDNNLIINKLNIESPANLNVNLILNSAILQNTVYTLSIKNLQDCSGNVLTESQIKFGNTSTADSGDVIINEVLFNPKSGGQDFIEIYNRSEKLLSLKDWTLANVDNSGKIANQKSITATNFVLQPHQFLVLTKNMQAVLGQYSNGVKDNFLEMTSLPSYPDDAGTVVLLNHKQQILDRLDYSEKWHSALLNDVSGVSLERKYYTSATNDSNNWQSAATASGYATPGYENSQSMSENSLNTEIFVVSPEVFTPDGDGQDEVTKLNFKFLNNGNYATINIYDINGKKIKQLTDNQLLGTNGSIEWNGTNGSNQVVSVGYYIILAEVFNPNGAVKNYKMKVVVGSKF